MLSEKTQITTYSTEVNILKREAPIENGCMLPHYVEDVIENIVIEEKNQGCYEKCNKGFVGICFEGRRVCRRCCNEIVNEKRGKKTVSWKKKTGLKCIFNCGLSRSFCFKQNEGKRK